MIKEYFGFESGNFSAKVYKSGKTFVACFSFGDYAFPQMTLTEIKQFMELIQSVLDEVEVLIRENRE